MYANWEREREREESIGKRFVFLQEGDDLAVNNS